MKPEPVFDTPAHTFYLPGLNGLRAIAALAVVVSHVTLDLGKFGLDATILGTDSAGRPQGLLLAGFGVSIFFALSGFLITYLLLLESMRTKISLPKFYLRRILRIWPLYYLYLFVTSVILWLCEDENLAVTLPYYVFFAPNIPFILGVPLSYLAHYWSLGVEEQFYLLWPVLIKQFAHKALGITILLASVLISIKLLLHVWMPGSIAETSLHVTRFQCMLIGAIGAILHKEKHVYLLIWIDNKITQSIAWGFILLLAINRFHLASVIDNEIISVVAVALIIGQIEQRNRLICLENEFFDFLGRISYGIYVIHPLVILLCATIFRPMIAPGAGGYALAYGTVLAFTIAGAYLLNRYVEKPFLLLKSRFAVVPSSGTKHFEGNQKTESLR